MPHHVFLATLIAVLGVAGPSCAHRPPTDDRAARLEIAGGALEVELIPDGGRPLALTPADGCRWVFRGATSELVGRSYSIALGNRSPERLKVVVAVDGLNVYDRVPVSGRADRDVGSILGPWSQRTLAGWQLGLDRAQRFVFAPPEWSEGRDLADSRIGLVEVHLYRERPADPVRDRDAAPASPRSAQGPAAESLSAAEPGLGTSSGDDVASSVRVVRFAARTTWPEVRAELDYGRRGPTPALEPPPIPLHLGVTVVPDRDGCRILSVEPGSTADRAGLATGDVITRADVVSRPTPEDLRRLIERKRTGDRLFLDLCRGPHQLALKIRVE